MTYISRVPQHHWSHTWQPKWCIEANCCLNQFLPGVRTGIPPDCSTHPAVQITFTTGYVQVQPIKCTQCLETHRDMSYIQYLMLPLTDAKLPALKAWSKRQLEKVTLLWNTRRDALQLYDDLSFPGQIVEVHISHTHFCVMFQNDTLLTFASICAQDGVNLISEECISHSAKTHMENLKNKLDLWFYGLLCDWPNITRLSSQINGN